LKSAALQAKLWYLQRMSAMVLALCVFVHLGTMIYAVRGGLTAAEILSRTQGNIAWLIFYFIFLLATAIHVPIGIKNIAEEWMPMHGNRLGVAAIALAVLLLLAGGAAIIGLVFPPRP
jgi:fumarate reductase subunit C